MSNSHNHHKMQYMVSSPICGETSSGMIVNAPIERVPWESCVGWEDLSWSELSDSSPECFTAWEDLKSSSHWEESKSPVQRLMEDAANQQFMDSCLVVSNSPEGDTLLDSISNDLSGL